MGVASVAGRALAAPDAAGETQVRCRAGGRWRHRSPGRRSMAWSRASRGVGSARTAGWPSWRDCRAGRAWWAGRCASCRRTVTFPGTACWTRPEGSARGAMPWATKTCRRSCWSARTCGSWATWCRWRATCGNRRQRHPGL